MRQTTNYQQARDDLLVAEQELIKQRERVAMLRRELPLENKVEKNYTFLEGPKDLSRNSSKDFFSTDLASLFAPGKNELIIAHMMFAPDAKKPCPMCNMWVEGYNGIADYLNQATNFVVIARTQLERLHRWARDHNWHKLRLLSSYESSFNADFGLEAKTDPKRQMPGVSVFVRQANGDIYHYYTTASLFENIHHRAMDLFTPVWNLLDLTPSGRSEWMPSV